MNDIEKDFENTAKQINLKIKEAAEALKEANRLANAAGLSGLAYTQYMEDGDGSLDDLDEESLKRLDEDEDWDGETSPMKMKIEMLDISDLESAIENAGWSTSSSYC